jgi:hypothetical protein
VFYRHLQNAAFTSYPLLDDVIGGSGDHALNSELMELVNEAAKSDFQVAWWGTLVELRADESEWARDLREQFRELEFEDADGVPSSEAIGDDEFEDFVGFVAGYGH